MTELLHHLQTFDSPRDTPACLHHKLLIPSTFSLAWLQRRARYNGGIDLLCMYQILDCDCLAGSTLLLIQAVSLIELV